MKAEVSRLSELEEQAARLLSQAREAYGDAVTPEANRLRAEAARYRRKARDIRYRTARG